MNETDDTFTRDAIVNRQPKAETDVRCVLRAQIEARLEAIDEQLRNGQLSAAKNIAVDRAELMDAFAMWRLDLAAVLPLLDTPRRKILLLVNERSIAADQREHGSFQVGDVVDGLCDRLEADESEIAVLQAEVLALREQREKDGQR